MGMLVVNRRKVVITGFALVVIAVVAVLVMRSYNTKNTVVSNNPIVAGYQAQLPALTKTAKDHPDDAKAQQDYAIALYATGDTSQAQAEYLAAAKLDPNNATLHNNLGNTYRDLGNYQKAVESYQQAIVIDPKAQNAYINLANLYLYTLNQSDAAIKTYKEALKNIPNNQELEILLGIAYEHSGDKNNAKATYKQVLSANANNAAAQAGLKRVQ